MSNRFPNLLLATPALIAAALIGQTAIAQPDSGSTIAVMESIQSQSLETIAPVSMRQVTSVSQLSDVRSRLTGLFRHCNLWSSAMAALWAIPTRPIVAVKP